MVANKIDPTMCEHHKGGQDSTSLEQLKHYHVPSLKLEFYTLPTHISRASTLISNEFSHFVKS
jgi:hypothetical protein